MYINKSHKNNDKMNIFYNLKVQLAKIKIAMRRKALEMKALKIIKNSKFKINLF
jgi:hypothetical protein